MPTVAAPSMMNSHCRGGGGGKGQRVLNRARGAQEQRLSRETYLPAVQAVGALHLEDGGSEQAAEGVAELLGDVEAGDALAELRARVPAGLCGERAKTRGVVQEPGDRRQEQSRRRRRDKRQLSLTRVTTSEKEQQAGNSSGRAEPLVLRKRARPPSLLDSRERLHLRRQVVNSSWDCREWRGRSSAMSSSRGRAWAARKGVRAAKTHRKRPRPCPGSRGRCARRGCRRQRVWMGPSSMLRRERDGGGDARHELRVVLDGGRGGRDAAPDDGARADVCAGEQRGGRLQLPPVGLLRRSARLGERDDAQSPGRPMREMRRLEGIW